MIEGELGHHFQVDEMRHTASTACLPFTACRSAERCCCPCTSSPPCPASTADKKHILAEAAFSQDWELSLPGLCRVQRACACQTAASPADLIAALPGVNAEQGAHPSCKLPSCQELLPEGPIRNGSSTTYCPASHK